MRSAAVVSTANLPESAFEPVNFFWSPISNRIRYCNQGKYILAEEGEKPHFYVLDSGTLQVKAAIVIRPKGDAEWKPKIHGSYFVPLAFACAANAGVAAFEVWDGPYGSGVLKVFDLDTGLQTGEIPEAISPGRLTDIQVSSSGRSAVVLLDRGLGGGDPAKPGDLVIFDLEQMAVSRRLLTGGDGEAFVDIRTGGGAGEAFIGESRIAVGGAQINVFDLQTGVISQQFTFPGGISGAPISASADGRVLLGYSGQERFVDGKLQIDASRFTLWDTRSGQVLGRSEKLPVHKTSDFKDFLNPFAVKSSYRPALDLSSSGDTVLVAQTGFSKPALVYRLTSASSPR